MPSRVEREIDEILQRIDTSLPREAWPRRLRRGVAGAVSAARHAARAAVRSFAPGSAMLVAFALIIASLFISRAWSDAGRFVLIAGIALFLLALVASFAGRRAEPERRWRGRVIRYDEPTLAERVRNWWRTKSRRPRER